MNNPNSTDAKPYTVDLVGGVMNLAILRWWRSLRLVHWGVHTEYAGPGRVRFVSFFGGAGYVVRIKAGRGWNGMPLDARGWRTWWRALNIWIPGFTIMWRTCKSAQPSTLRGRPVKRVRITRNPNQSIV